jgi:hypothetical protein
MNYLISITGTRPTLMHNARLANPMDPYAKAVAKLVAKPGKNRTDDDRMAIARADWEGGLYFDNELGPYFPAENVFQSFVEGGRLTRSGKKIERGIQFLGDIMLPLLYDGPRTLDEMWGDGITSPFVDTRTVGQGQNRVVRTRPIFRHWGLEAEVAIDTLVIDPEEFERIVVTAGITAGLGDYRRHYGRYEAKAVPAD